MKKCENKRRLNFSASQNAKLKWPLKYRVLQYAIMFSLCNVLPVFYKLLSM